VKLAATAEGGKEMIIDVIVEGDFFGEDVLISPEISRHYNAICITDAEVLKVDAQQLSKNLKTNAETAHMFIAYLLKRNRALQEHLANCLLNAGPQCLMCTLKANEERLRQSGKLSQTNSGGNDRHDKAIHKFPLTRISPTEGVLKHNKINFAAETRRSLKPHSRSANAERQGIDKSQPMRFRAQARDS
jgi:hypothetical protein